MNTIKGVHPGDEGDHCSHKQGSGPCQRIPVLPRSATYCQSASHPTLTIVRLGAKYYNVVGVKFVRTAQGLDFPLVSGDSDYQPSTGNVAFDHY